MMWDFAEANPLSSATGNWMAMVNWVWKSLATVPAGLPGTAQQENATATGVRTSRSCPRTRRATSNLSGDAPPPLVVSTDPPYYDNIGYADLSDFFYVWLRRSLRPAFPDLFATLAVPKAEELVATPYRHGGKDAAEAFFLEGMTEALQRLATQAHPGFPTTVFYAFKQSERKGGTGVASTGWETFLDAAIESGFAISGTWPMRTELGNRMVGMGANALASSIILVCRRRPADARPATRRDFLLALRSELPRALRLLQSGNIAPVDLDQAAIGPGMAVYTRHERLKHPRRGGRCRRMESVRLLAVGPHVRRSASRSPSPPGTRRSAQRERTRSHLAATALALRARRRSSRETDPRLSLRRRAAAPGRAGPRLGRPPLPPPAPRADAQASAGRTGHRR